MKILDAQFFCQPLHERLRQLVDEKWSHLGHGYRKLAAGEIGISDTQLSKTLKGRHAPSDDVLSIFSASFGLSSDLLRGLSVQVAGTVSAGGGIDDATAPFHELSTGKLFPPGTIAYLVHGTSMRDADICEGDYIFVRREPVPVAGEIVVLYHPDKDGTLVKLKRDRSYEGANERDPHPPIPWVPGCKEYGVLIGVVREVKPVKRTRRNKS